MFAQTVQPTEENKKSFTPVHNNLRRFLKYYFNEASSDIWYFFLKEYGNFKIDIPDPFCVSVFASVI